MDALSQIPLLESVFSVSTPPDLILMMEILQRPPVNARDIRRWTDCTQFRHECRTSFYRLLEEKEMQPFNNRKDKLSVQDGCVLWGSRVLVSKVGHEKVLDELHEGHPRVSRMKGLARGVVWWLGMDKYIGEN